MLSLLSGLSCLLQLRPFYFAFMQFAMSKISKAKMQIVYFTAFFHIGNTSFRKRRPLDYGFIIAYTAVYVNTFFQIFSKNFFGAVLLRFWQLGGIIFLQNPLYYLLYAKKHNP